MNVNKIPNTIQLNRDMKNKTYNLDNHIEIVQAFQYITCNVYPALFLIMHHVSDAGFCFGVQVDGARTQTYCHIG